MLRMIFVISIILAGMPFAAQGAFYGLLFYLWNAYFRPENWVYDDVDPASSACRSSSALMSSCGRWCRCPS